MWRLFNKNLWRINRADKYFFWPLFTSILSNFICIIDHFWGLKINVLLLYVSVKCLLSLSVTPSISILMTTTHRRHPVDIHQHGCCHVTSTSAPTTEITTSRWRPLTVTRHQTRCPCRRWGGKRKHGCPVTFAGRNSTDHRFWSATCGHTQVSVRLKPFTLTCIANSSEIPWNAIGSAPYNMVLLPCIYCPTCGL